MGENKSNEKQDVTLDFETSNILIAYFSRVGNTDYPSDVDATTSASIVVDDADRYRTTEYLARTIQQKVGGNLQRIETKETYPINFDDVVDQNHQEMNQDVCELFRVAFSKEDGIVLS